jgi:hypothetical protein
MNSFAPPKLSGQSSEKGWVAAYFFRFTWISQARRRVVFYFITSRALINFFPACRNETARDFKVVINFYTAPRARCSSPFSFSSRVSFIHRFEFEMVHGHFVFVCIKLFLGEFKMNGFVHHTYMHRVRSGSKIFRNRWFNRLSCRIMMVFHFLWYVKKMSH